MNIAFRTDASLQIGSGHVMPCLTLADELKKSGAKITFITRDHPGDAKKRFFSVHLRICMYGTLQRNN